MTDLFKKRARLLRNYRSYSTGARGAVLNSLPTTACTAGLHEHSPASRRRRIRPNGLTPRAGSSAGLRALAHAPNNSRPVMAGRSAPCTDRRCMISFGEGTDALARFLLVRGPLQASSKYAPLNSLLKDHQEGIPEDAAVPEIMTRRHKKTCERPNCMGRPNCCGGRTCERLNSWRAGELDPTLQEDFVGPVDMPWHMREPGREERYNASSDSDRDMPARPRPRDAERQHDAAKRPSVSDNPRQRLDEEFQRRALLPWQKG